MLKPIFTKGTALHRSLNSAPQAGARILYCDESRDFSIGDRVFVAEADGSELEYMGVVRVSGDPPWLETTLSMKKAKSANAAIWRAQSVFQWETVTAAPVQRVFHEGIVVDRSVGGGLWAVRVADPVREDTLRFNGVSRASFAAFRAWLAASTRNGLEEFTWVDEERQIARVRLLRCDLVQAENAPRTLAFDLKLAILAEGECI